jgi:AcrR family transcriptional regulator
MKKKIILKAADLFLELGFKSVTMDQIASEMCISKKTIYRYFCNKELLIKESTVQVYKTVHKRIDVLIGKNHNAIEENFQIRKMLSEMLRTVDSSPIYQLKKHYLEIYNEVMSREFHKCNALFKQNIEKGIQQGLYRNDLNLQYCVYFYYTLIFNISGNTSSEKESNKLELGALEYHTRAMATPKGLIELEKQLQHIGV